jgi:peptide/nickel transport system substrate-binding protein
VRVRRALSLAVDRTAVIEAEGGPLTARPACQILPPSFPGYEANCSPQRDLAEAKRLAAASGTRGMRVEAWTTSIGVQFMAPIVTTLEQLGYRARLRIEDGAWDYRAIQLGPDQLVRRLPGGRRLRTAPLL